MKQLSGGIILFETVHSKKDTASSRIRGRWLMNYWPELTEYVNGQKYNFIIYQKSYLVKHAKLYDGIKIFDVVDPDWVQGQAIKNMIDNVDAITCSTEPLAQFLRQLTDKPVVVIPDRQDLSFFKEKKIHQGKAKEVVWYGYSHNASAVKVVKKSLIRFGLNISIISDKPMSIFTKDDRTICQERYTQWKLETVNQEIIKSDIVIMPSSTNPNFRYKSNNRITNAWALRMPVAHTVEDLKRFIDPIEREKEAEMRYNEVLDKYDVRQSVEEFKQLIKRLKK